MHRYPVHLLVIALAVLCAACDVTPAKSTHGSVTVRLPPARPAAAPGFSKEFREGQDVLTARSDDGNHAL